MSAEANVIFRDAVPNVAGVVVFGLGGFFSVHKQMPSAGRTIRSVRRFSKQKYAIRYAVGFLEGRAKIAGVNYVPGAGKDTMLFKPVGIDIQP